MADNKISLPSGSGGITRYFDEKTSNVEISPKAVIVICILIIVFEIILHKTNMFG